MNKRLISLYITIFWHYPSLGQEIRYDVIASNLPMGDRYLDIWCGTGEFILANRHKFKECYGVDITDERFGKYAEKIQKNNISLLRQDATNLSQFPDEYFDVISLSDVLEHTTEYKKILSEVYRVLKSEGTFCLTVPWPHDNVWKYHFLWHVIPWFPLENIKKDLSDAGFSMTRYQLYGWLLTNWIVGLGLWTHPYLSGLLFPIWWALHYIEKGLRGFLWKNILYGSSAYDGIFILAKK